MARNVVIPIQPFTGRDQEAKPTSVSELCDRYQDWSDGYYLDSAGLPTGTHKNVLHGLRALREAAGHMKPDELSPAVLEHVQEELTKAGNALRTINDRIDVIKRMSKWAAQRQFITSATFTELQIVARLKPGKCQARQPVPVRPVAWDAVRATLPFLNRHIASMVTLQWHTGMRSGEICIMRPCDIDRTNKVWVYQPAQHKSQYRGRARIVAIGPAGQTVIEPFLLGRNQNAYIFSPIEARAEFQLSRTLARIIPLHQGNRVGSNRKLQPQRKPGERYKSQSYYRAVQRGCDDAFPHPDGLSAMNWCHLTKRQRQELIRWRVLHRWHPHQLRHAAATRLRRELGIEAARAVLGHSDVRVTEMYAERDIRKAMEVMEILG